jgi:DNA polymerase I-like protein with 3'-5' exonuclease and polymerase domains
MIAIDTEVTGLDIRHGAKPFFVTACEQGKDPLFWEWDVDPLTREPKIPGGDKAEIRALLRHHKEYVLQNAKFDIHGLAAIGVEIDWAKVDDTLMAGHILASNQRHDLTAMALLYIGVDILPQEKALEKAVLECRHLVQQARLQVKRGRGFEDEEGNLLNDSPDLAKWRICEEGLPEMPSASEKTWRYDYWLPRAMAKHRQKYAGHEWWSVLRNYGCADSEATAEIWSVMRKEMQRRQLFEMYRKRIEAVKVLHRMEQKGLTVIRSTLEPMKQEYIEEAATCHDTLMGIAEEHSYPLKLAKGSALNNSMREFLFTTLKLPPLAYTDGGQSGNCQPKFDKDVVKDYITALPRESLARSFVKNLDAYRKRGKQLEFMEAYEKFGISNGSEFLHLYPSINPCGTNNSMATTRKSSSNPNAQQICFDGDTELLTKSGWVMSSMYIDGTPIAQYDKHDNSVSFVVPAFHRNNFVGQMHHIRTEQQIDMLLTPAHRCLIRNRRTGTFSDTPAERFTEDCHHLHGGRYIGGELSLTPEEVSWLCAVQADGSYVEARGGEYGISFGLRKDRKIERLTKTLAALGASFSKKKRGPNTWVYVGVNEPIVQTAKRMMPSKRFGNWVLSLDRSTLDLFVDEVFLWDGNLNRAEYSSKHKDNAEWVQIALALSCKRASVIVRPSNGDHYRVNVDHKQYSLTSNFTRELVPWDGPVYCVTVPSSYIVARRSGKTFVTGNSKQETECEECQGEGCDECDHTGEDLHSMRRCFGPETGREWYSADASNIELRLPAYEAGEQSMIALFEKSKEPPFFGSNHMLIFSGLWPELWEPALKKVGIDKVAEYCKHKYKHAEYQWTKNGDFAIQYLCGVATANRAYHKVGAYDVVKGMFPAIHGPGGLNDFCMSFARKRGYIETIPERGCKNGYPLMVSRTERGDVMPTLPLNYRIQGSAGIWMDSAMVRCQRLLDDWRATDGFDGYIILTVHDELLFDFPRTRVTPLEELRDKKLKGRSNLWRIRAIQAEMEKGGEDIGIPTPVSVEWHDVSWAKGVAI